MNVFPEEERDTRNEIVRTIMVARERFCEKYHVMPHYVKIPKWVYKFLVDVTFTTVEYNAKACEFFYGLEMCVTPAISELCEIEVF